MILKTLIPKLETHCCKETKKQKQMDPFSHKMMNSSTACIFHLPLWWDYCLIIRITQCNQLFSLNYWDLNQQTRLKKSCHFSGSQAEQTSSQWHLMKWEQHRLETVSYHDWGKTSRLGRRLLIGSLSEWGDDPLPVAQGANLNNLKNPSAETQREAQVPQHTSLSHHHIQTHKFIQAKLTETHPKHTDTESVACTPRWQASTGKQKRLSSIIQPQSVLPSAQSSSSVSFPGSIFWT